MIITKRLGKGILKKCIPEKNQNPKEFRITLDKPSKDV